MARTHRPKVSTNAVLTIALPPEYFGVLTILDEIAVKKGITRSAAAREIICESICYNPKIERKIYEFKTVPVRVRQKFP